MNEKKDWHDAEHGSESYRTEELNKSQIECFLSLFHTEYAFVGLGVAVQRQLI